jgi:hypothetical protein
MATKDKYADCYVKNGNGTFDHWSTRITNGMYHRICFDDSKIDMAKSTDYQQVSMEGEGIGT